MNDEGGKDVETAPVGRFRVERGEDVETTLVGRLRVEGGEDVETIPGGVSGLNVEKT